MKLLTSVFLIVMAALSIYGIYQGLGWEDKTIAEISDMKMTPGLFDNGIEFIDGEWVPIVISPKLGEVE